MTTTSTTLEPSTTNEDFPERFIEVASSVNFTFFLQGSGNLWATGLNNSGQLGLGNTDETYSPRIVKKEVFKVDVGVDHAGWIDFKNDLYLVGNGYHGELAINPNEITGEDGSTTKNNLETARIASISTNIDLALAPRITLCLVEQIADSFYGIVFACGDNAEEFLGVGSEDPFVFDLSPVVGLPENIVSIDAGHDHFCAIDTDGALWAWGNNNFGKARGDGSDIPLLAPRKVIDQGVSKVSCGESSTIVTLDNGRVLATGKTAGTTSSIWFDIIGEPLRNYSMTETFNMYDENLLLYMYALWIGEQGVIINLAHQFAFKFVPVLPSEGQNGEYIPGATSYDTKFGKVYSKYINDQTGYYYTELNVTFQEVEPLLWEIDKVYLPGWGVALNDPGLLITYTKSETTTGEPTTSSTTEEPTTSTSSTTEEPTTSTSSTTEEPTTSTSTTIDPATLDSDGDEVNDAEDYFLNDSRISATESELQTWVQDTEATLDNNSTDPKVIRALRTYDNTLELGKFYLFFRDDYGVIEMTDQEGNSDGSLSADLSDRNEGWEVIKPFVTTTTSSTTEQPTTSTSTTTSTTGEPTTTQDPNRDAVAGDSILSMDTNAYFFGSIFNYGGAWAGSGTYDFPVGDTAIILEVIPPPSSGYAMYKVSFQGVTRYISEALRFQYNWINLLPSQQTTTSTTEQPTTSSTTEEPTTSTSTSTTSTTEEPTTSTSSTTEEPTTSTSTTIDPASLDSDGDGINDAEDYFFNDNVEVLTKTELESFGFDSSSQIADWDRIKFITNNGNPDSHPGMIPGEFYLIGDTEFDGWRVMGRAGSQVDSDGNILKIYSPDRGTLWEKLSDSPTTTTSTSTTSTSTTSAPVTYDLIGSVGENIGRSLRYNSDGSVLAIGSDSMIQVFDVNGEQLTQLGQDIVKTESAILSLALSDDGSILAVGEGALNKVSVYRFNGSTWGSPEVIPSPGGSSSPRFGYDVDLNQGGSILVASDIYQDTSTTTQSGAVYVYFHDGFSWGLASSIEPSNIGSYANFGWSIGIDSSGSNLFVGAPGFGSSVGINNSGLVQHYSIDSALNVALVDTIYESGGQVAGNRFGKEISVGSDGFSFAVGIPDSAPVSSNEGSVQVFEKVSGSWIIKGETLTGLQRREYFGTSVSLSGDGSTLISGSRGYDLTNSSIIYETGKARIYSYSNGSWVLIEEVIGVESNEYLGEFVTLSKNGLKGAVASHGYGDDQGAISLLTLP